MHFFLAALALLITAEPGWTATFKQCKGIVLKDSCDYGGVCPDGPTWQRGEVTEFMDWHIEDGVKVLSEYRIGSILAANVKLLPGCSLPKGE